jgi:hypothetical protein
MNFNLLNIHNNPYYKQKKQELRKSCNYQLINIKMKNKKLEFELKNSIRLCKINYYISHN